MHRRDPHYPQFGVNDLDLFAHAERTPVATSTISAPGVQAACSPPAAVQKELPGDVQRLILELRDAHGEVRAITAESLAVRLWGICLADGSSRGGNNSGAVRRVRLLLAQWLDRFPFPVAAGDHGYYRPATHAEAEHYYASLVSRASEIEGRAWTFARQCRGQGWDIGPSDPAHERLAAHQRVLRGRAA